MPDTFQVVEFAERLSQWGFNNLQKSIANDYLNNRISAEDFMGQVMITYGDYAAKAQYGDDIRLIHSNLISLGDAVSDVSQSLSEQVAQLRSKDADITKWITATNKDVSAKLVSLGKSVTDASQGSTTSGLLGGLLGGSGMLILIVIVMAMKK